MSSRKFFTKFSSYLISFGALGFYSPIYAHHVPGATSAVAEISVVGCDSVANPTCKVTLTTATTPALKCFESIDGKRNVTCNLPNFFKIPAAPVSGQPQFEFTRTASLSDTTLGAEFVATCNAASQASPCNDLTTLSLKNTTIKKLSATTTTAQKVEIKLGFTLGLLPDSSLNDSVLDPTKGFAHTFSARGTAVPSSGLTALNNTHTAQYSFTYVLSSATCGTTTASSPEPFSIAGCTATKAVPCVNPPTSLTTGVTCSSTGGDFVLKSITSNGITTAGRFDLQDLTQRTCANLFTTGNPSCRAIERQNATVSYGFVRQNDKVNITGSAVGNSGRIPSVLTASTGEGLKCNLHESAGGVSLNPNDQGQFKIQVFGDANISTSTMDASNTFIGLSGGPVIQAKSIRYNQDFDRDGFFDAWVVFDSSELEAGAGISCSQFAGQTITLLMLSAADVTVSGEILVAGKEKKGTQSFGQFTTVTPDAPVSCEIPAKVGPCNNP